MAFKTALIVDDSKLARITLKKKLEEKGLTVEMAKSAEEAFSALPLVHPDIIFMDHQMPGIDGFEATQKIRLMPGFSTTPIIMCSGTDKADYLEEAQAIGANQILAKPPLDHSLEDILATDFSVLMSSSVIAMAENIEPVIVSEEVSENVSAEITEVEIKEEEITEETIIESVKPEEIVVEIEMPETVAEIEVAEVVTDEVVADEVVSDEVAEVENAQEVDDGEFDFEEMMANAEPLPESYGTEVEIEANELVTTNEVEIQIEEIVLDDLNVNNDSNVSITEADAVEVAEAESLEADAAVSIEENKEIDIPLLATPTFSYEDIQSICRRILKENASPVDMNAVSSLINLSIAQQVPSIMEKIQRELSAPIYKIESQFADVEMMIVDKVSEVMTRDMEGILDLSLNAKIAEKFAGMDKNMANLEKKILLPKKADPMDTALVLRQTGDQHKSIELMYEDLREVKKNLRNIQIMSAVAFVLASLATAVATIVYLVS